MGADSASSELYVARDHRYVHHHAFWLITKRVFDIVVATLGLLVAAPLFAIIAIAIKSDTRGPGPHGPTTARDFARIQIPDQDRTPIGQWASRDLVGMIQWLQTGEPRSAIPPAQLEVRRA